MSQFIRRMTMLLWAAMLWGAVGTGAGRAGELAEPPVFYLHTEFLPYTRPIENAHSNRLVRELVRQAILIAARDEMGLTTRDESLQEADPTQAIVVHIMPMERGDEAGQWRLRLVAAEEGTQWETTFEIPGQGLERYGELAKRLEADSRGKMLEGLRACGVEGAPPAVTEASLPGAEVEALLSRPDVVAQYGAVRMAHEAIAKRGETAEWLGVLVRGYANLALLTRHYWNSVPEAFTARAWLYAQRLVVKTDHSDMALWHRAYALAWGGLLTHAAADLEEVERRREASGNGREGSSTDPPAWVHLTQAFSRFDRAAAQRVMDDSPLMRPWGVIVRFTLAHFDWNQPQLRADLREIASVCPSAYMVFSHWGDFSALTPDASPLETQLSPRYFSREAPRSVAMLPGLPIAVSTLTAKVSQLADTSDAEGAPPLSPNDFSPLPMEIATQLRTESAGVAVGEPSWSCLATLLEEEQFLLVLRYLAALQRRSQLLPREVTDPLLPLVKGHRYAAYVEGYRFDFQLHGTDVINAWKTLKVVDARPNMFLLLYGLRVLEFSSEPDRIHSPSQYSNSPRTLHGVDEALSAGVTMGSLDASYITESVLEKTRAAAPHSSRSVHLAILGATDPEAEQLAEWEAQLTDNPAPWSDLAILYHRRGDRDAAVRCGQKSLALCPNSRAAWTLSNVYLEMGDAAQSESTLLQTLASIEGQSEQFAVRGMLASWYLERGLWNQALPHALACAEAGSQFGLYTASQITEALAQWKESERWIRQLAENYAETHAAQWYFWCERTGRGDLETARKHAEKYLRVRVQLASREAAEDGTYQLLRGNRRSALAAFRRAWSLEPNLLHAFLVARLAGVWGDSSLRTEVLDGVKLTLAQPESHAAPNAVEADTAERAVLALIRAPEITPETLQEIDPLLRSCDMRKRGELAYIVGQDLADRGRAEEALSYWRRALANPGAAAIPVTLAGWELAKREITSRGEDAPLRDGELWPDANSTDGD
jgi:tetratricopeptide (TPR) repeat protein